MVGKKKVIGVCMTKIHGITRAEMVQLLYAEAKRVGYKLMIFNSPFDFYYGNDNEAGASGIYEYINYEIVDALVILCSTFIDKNVYKKIVHQALEHQIPVILEEEQMEGCYTVRNAFEKPFKDLINHVIREHGAKDTFFMAGFKGNQDSEERMAVYKEALEENGLSFDESMFDYGCFWEEPTFAIVDRLVAGEKKLPQAIICANDTMAMSTCTRLKMHGVRVPEDVIVTGFDGVRMSEYSEPRIATCAKDHVGFAAGCVQMVDQILQGSAVEKVYESHYSVRVSESCGCRTQEEPDYRKVVSGYQKLFDHMKGHEHFIYDEINTLLNASSMDINTFYSAIASIIDADSFIAMRPSFLSEIVSEEQEPQLPDEELVILAKKNDHFRTGVNQYKFLKEDMIPGKKDWEQNDTAYVLSPIQVGRVLFGYYGVQTTDIVDNGQRINRILNMVNMISHMAVSSFRQRFFKIDKRENAMVDIVTELANLYGATEWFENFVADPANQNKTLALSVYALPRYRYIYDNYGLKEVESAVCMVAEALRLSNTNDSFVAHIADDEFIVINYMNEEAELPSRIDSATTVFYGLLERFNRVNEKEYYVEVNAGCTHVKITGQEKMETLIKKATKEMYDNMVLYGTLPALKDGGNTSKEEYFLFHALISQNLFHYYFQPIVNMDDGSIYGYEALMRTDQRIGMNPLEVLSIASEYQRLYDVEKATIFNVMELYVNNKEIFQGKKIFMNCIPGHFLNEDDNRRLSEKYAPYIENFVFEITEQDTVTKEELHVLRRIGNENGTNWIAVDDYGVGHSNIVNLINYAPQVVKIDRFLMTDIDQDDNKQILLRGVIEFAKRNNIKVLAEGIETAAELRKVIELGVDYVQGYYTGKPMPEPIREIRPEIRAQILEFQKYR